uniref:Uncharacterized protein n=1 Tax=Knipowitschia caucasica TaxID=637954 RepID=A0AAV2JXG1_KNICA
MKALSGLSSLWSYLMLVLSSATQIRAQDNVLPPIITSTPAPLDLRDLANDGQTSQSLVPHAHTSADVTDVFTTRAATHVSSAGAGATTSSTASEGTQTPLGSSTTQSSGIIVSSQPASTSLSGTPSVLPSTEPLGSLATASAAESTGGFQDIATYRDTPSQLNVGGEDVKRSGHPSLDPLLAGLLSVFIVTTAVIFVVLFLKFRHQNSNPEFHRLQDVPMSQVGLGA